LPPVPVRARRREPTNVHVARKVAERVLEERTIELTYDQTEAVRYFETFGILDEEDLEEAAEELREIVSEISPSDEVTEVLVNKILEVLPRTKGEVLAILEFGGKRLLRRADEDIVNGILGTVDKLLENVEE